MSPAFSSATSEVLSTHGDVSMQACSERVHELTTQLPKLQAEAAKAEQDMAAAQQQSEDADITDEGREALLERIQSLTSTESEVKQRLLEAEQVRLFPTHGSDAFMHPVPLC